MVVGLSGPYCSGKSTLGNILAQRGYFHIEVDHLGHKALEAQKDAIVKSFGTSVLGDEGIDRKKLGAVVFQDPQDLKRLEALVHPWMVAQVENMIANAGSSTVLVNAALLFRMGLDKLCSPIIWVTAPFTVRLRRAQSRDQLTLSQGWKRLLAADKPKFSPDRSDIFIVDNRNKAHSLAELESILERFG